MYAYLDPLIFGSGISAYPYTFLPQCISQKRNSQVERMNDFGWWTNCLRSTSQNLEQKINVFFQKDVVSLLSLTGRSIVFNSTTDVQLHFITISVLSLLLALNPL